VHRGGRGQSIVYELLYDGDLVESTRHMMGLIRTGDLYDDETLGVGAKKTAPSQGQVSTKSASSKGKERAVSLDVASDTKNSDKKAAKNTVPIKNEHASYHNSNSPLVAQ